MGPCGAARVCGRWRCYLHGTRVARGGAATTAGAGARGAGVAAPAPCSVPAAATAPAACTSEPLRAHHPGTFGGRGFCLILRLRGSSHTQLYNTIHKVE